MGKSVSYSTSMLALLFLATPIANVADDAASSPLTNIYASLHTGSPGTGGDQTTNECDYTSYARVAVARQPSPATWDISSGAASPAANIEFPTATGGSNLVTHCALGKASSSTGLVYYQGTVTPNITVTTGVQPILTTATTVTEA